MTEEERIKKLEDEVGFFVRKWQMILRLQDWDVFYKVVRRGDMPLPNAQASMAVEENLKSAYVNVLHPDDYPPGPEKQDIEASVVHELLHVHTSPFAPSRDEHDPGCGAATVAEEQMVNALAHALVKLDRGNKYTEN